MATTDEILANISTQLDALIENPQVDYVEGDVEVKAGQKITQLLKAAQFLLKHPEADISTMGFAFGVSQFGENHTIHENDNTGG